MDLFHLLYQVSKPTRYAGNEFNAIHKDWNQVRLCVALAYPDLYEIGMSNLALKILYGILNGRPDILAERVFNPWPDAEQAMRRGGLSLFSLESWKPLREFDIFGFTLPYELCYTNILNMLNLAGIPFPASDRDESYPLLVGGGPGAFNPEPLADFFDLFVLGDGEEVILELADIDIQAKGEKWPKDLILRKMAELPGVYVPSHFQVIYHVQGTIQDIIPLAGKPRIEKRIIHDLNRAYYPTRPVIPYAEAVHDRAALEIARGCSRGCRFCQAGFLYRPVRERSLDSLHAMARDSIESTGYEELALVSLSSSDYSQLEQLLGLLQNDCRSRMVALSLPSLRPGTLTPSIISYIKEIRRTGFTIAPEAGTQRLRNVINKGITEEDIYTTARQIFEQGWDLLKLYFMIGLPTEQPEDLEGIIHLSRGILHVGRSLKKRSIRINLTISPFVPKPHTPFQRMPQEPVGVLQGKEAILVKELDHRFFKVKYRNPEVSSLEGALARGDRRLGKVLVRAWELGSRFDQWSEQFDFSLWQRAFSESGLSISFYAHRSIEEGEVLPWEHLSSGVSSDFFTSEKVKALQGEMTPDCRLASCHGCGVCKSRQMAIPPFPSRRGKRVGQSLSEQGWPAASSKEAVPDTVEPLKGMEEEKACRIRAKFQKRGASTCMSHLDLIRVFSRAIRRADLPISFSRGFHPHPRISFGLALAVGIEGLGEYADFVFRTSLRPEEFLTRMNAQLPQGIEITQSKLVPLDGRSLLTVINSATYRVEIPAGVGDGLSDRFDYEKQIALFLAQDEIWVQKRKKHSSKRAGSSDVVEQINIRPFIIGMRFLKDSAQRQDAFLISLAIGRQSISPWHVLESFYDGRLDFSFASFKVIRLGLHVHSSDQLLDPLDIA
ncbi:MAG: TIGR03960 family B12-binding radical SAM protein [bacterium]